MTRQHYLLFRSFTSLIFIYAGIKHLLHPDAILNRILRTTAYKWLPYQEVFSIAVYASGVLMLIGGLSLLAGFKPARAAALLLAMLMPITLTIQLENLNDLGPFFKNLAIAGSLVYLIKRKEHENKNIRPGTAII